MTKTITRKPNIEVITNAGEFTNNYLTFLFKTLYETFKDHDISKVEVEQ
jgi:hypothetical protein